MIARPASTVVLVRDSPVGLITYVLVRNAALEFAPGATVFPGGAVDPVDYDQPWVAPSVGYDHAAADAHLETEGGLAYWVAAARECFEEVGVLLGRPGVPDRSLTFADHLDLGHVPDLSDMWYLGHWITPEGAPRRYDTRFFISIVGDDCEPDPDRGELISGRWIRPEDALAEFDAGKIDLIDPTMRTLMVLHRAADVASLRSFFAGYERAAGPMVREGMAGFRLRLPIDD